VNSPTLDAHRRDTLLKTLRSNDFRRALKAIAELRHAREPGLAEAVAQFRAPDEQREVQYHIARVVLGHGVRGLVEAWPVPADPTWRAQLVSEIGQFFRLWHEEAIADLLVAAIEDRSRDVRAKATWPVLAIVRDEWKPTRVTKESQRPDVVAVNTLRAAVTPEQRARVMRAVLAMLKEHRETPYPVLPQLVEILGCTATSNDTAAMEALEALRGQSGEPYHVSYEKLDPSKLDWRERLVAERKGIDPARLKLRIAHRPTGLLDQKVLLEAVRRIQARGRW
jgi:hypothetical protein